MSEKSQEFFEKVNQINERLRGYGKQAVQEIKMVKRDKHGNIEYDGHGNEKVIGRIMYGYRPQYVFDAVNEIIGTENWRYEIVSKEIFGTQAVVEVRLFIRIENEWLCKGSQTGQMNIVKDNVGDAYKGSVTDALQKCFSLVSIGQDAYRGLLKKVYFGTSHNESSNRSPTNAQSKRQQAPQPEPNLQRKPSAQKQTPPPPPEAPQDTSAQEQASKPSLPPGLPTISGITFDVVSDRVVANGDTFKKKGLIKPLGFKWDGDKKHWYRNLAEFHRVA